MAGRSPVGCDAVGVSAPAGEQQPDHEAEDAAEPWPFAQLVEHYRVAYESALDGLRDQRVRVDETRSRSVTLLSVAAAVSAFLGDRVFEPAAFDRLETGWGSRPLLVKLPDNGSHAHTAADTTTTNATSASTSATPLLSGPSSTAT